MIEKVIVRDNNKTPIKYFDKVFDNGKEFEFKKGINIIIGPNGSGKSTLLDVIRYYMLCKDKYVSNIPDLAENLIELYEWFEGDKLLNGVDIIADYRLSTFNFVHASEIKNKRELTNMTEMALFMATKMSMGESLLQSLHLFFKKIFSNEIDVKFPIDKIKNKGVNELWKKRFDSLLSYYKKNHKDIDNLQFTILMDEPDRNLDIQNIDEVYNIIKTEKPDTQLICVVHNPVIINRLSKLDYVNFIETEKGYLQKVIDFVKK